MDKIEVLDPQYTSRDEVEPTLTRALRNFHTAKRTTLQVMVDLSTMQDRGAHIVFGATNFATWVEETFDGLGASNVKQLTRAGAVAIELQRRGLIDVDAGAPVGTRALRELSVVSNTFGDDKMAEVYVTARGMVTGKDVSERTVKAALQLLMPPAPTDLSIPEALDAGPDGEDEDDLREEEDGLTGAMQERLDRIRDLTYDLPDAWTEVNNEVQALGREIRGETVEDEEWLGKGR